MKKLFFCFLLLNFSCARAQEKFDIVTYKAPVGWQTSEKPGTLSFSKETGKSFCIITIYQAINASAAAKKNFDMSWDALVTDNLGGGKATMQPGSTDNGWKTLIGSASFEKEALKGTAILVSSSKNSKTLNILAITNTDAFQKEMEAFFESVTLKQDAATQNTNTQTVPPQTTKPSMGKAELWQFKRVSPIYTNIDGSIDKTATIYSDYIVIYPNGDYLQNPPFRGLKSLSKSNAPDSWGKFTMNGNKGLFKNKYDKMPVTKKSATHMECNGYVAGIYKCLPVDRLRIEGAYTHVSANWGKDPQLHYLHGPGCQFVIYFKKDGTFDDLGIFSSRAGGCTDCNCQGGKGTYSIENFTIIFQYDDGRMVERMFAAPPTRNPATYNETYYIGGTAYYKKN